ncbi:GNAT family N-acetyltransferase [Aliagarivorans marinus]|uniref:GNAT family N-acetyltransferase n=1 Tax=Aliagarivorans marinus TaxID=561965 RepID=UPI000408A956|nr:GNAT family N-acetyltransferase [Aliagarivorans marinus]
MSECVTFRPLQESDFAWLIAQVASPEELFLVHPAATFPWTDEQLRQLANERAALTIMLVGEQRAGFANLYQVQPRHSAFIGNVLVNGALRGRGLGRRLMQHMLEVCVARYQAQPHLSVFAENTRAQHLYQSLGFAVYDQCLRSTPDGHSKALLHMRHEP